jgi:DNA-binding IclR family transcriptional regulator
VIEFLHGSNAPRTTTAVAEGVGYPTPTARRALEDLRAHQIANRKPQGEGKADLWSLSAFARGRLDAARSVPEMSEDLNEEGFSEMSGLPITHPHRVFDDFSEKVPERGEA